MNLASTIEINPTVGPIEGSIRPPGSKSLTNRAIPIAAMAHGTSLISGVLESDDTRVMIESLTTLGIPIRHDRDQCQANVDGQRGGFPNSSGHLTIGNSGTTIRFLTAFLGIAGGEYSLDGTARMHERPIGPLVEALNSIGGDVEAKSKGGCPPVIIRSGRLNSGTIRLAGNLSSQYLSGLMMAAPLAKGGLAIKINGDLVSRPYVEMTRRVMADFGVTCSVNSAFNRFVIPGNQAYQPIDYLVEPDATAASYFWAAAAICGGSATVIGLDRNSIQGDVGFVNCLKQMGCGVIESGNRITVTGPAKHGIDIDMSNISDTVQTLASVALFVNGPTTVRNIAHNRIKETDRIGNLAIELRKLGARIDEQDDGMTIHPGPVCAAEINTYDDHRMAMSLALVGLRQPGVKIRDPGCVSKTYPNYFSDLFAFVSQRP